MHPYGCKQNPGSLFQNAPYSYQLQQSIFSALMVEIGTPMVNFYAPIVESGAPMGKCFCLSISVHRVHTTHDDSYVYTHLGPLAMDAIKQTQGYRFDRENQEIYLSRDSLEFIPRCQWPEIQLPIPQASPPPQPSVNEELKRGLQATHDSTVDMLHTQGVNPCQVYQEKDAITILANIWPQQVNCSFCNRVCKTTQKLKSHIRSHHLKAVASNK